MDAYIQFAKQAIEEYIKTGKVIPVPKDLSPEFYSRKAGVFVTIYKEKELRGCIGTYLPTKNNIAEEIIDNSIAACSRDFRFNKITEKDLPQLSYEVSILSEPKPVENIKKHNPRKDGIIVKCVDGRCGLLLPNLDGIDAVDQQISIACQKGGIDPRSDKIRLFEFNVEKHQ